MKLREGEFQLVARLVKDLAGVHLDESKGYLIESRLGPIAAAAGCANLNELYFKLKYDRGSELEQQVVDAITTHETLWFRDGSPFEALQFKALPESIDARHCTSRPRQLRIWSAACSTGQEPYCIAMVLHQLIPDIADWDVEILATDISKGSIATAERGIYSDHELSRTQRPEAMKRLLLDTPEGPSVRPEFRKLVRFRQLNLTEPLPAMGPFDIVFLRNVLIYFDVETKARLLDRIRTQMLPHGWLFIGSSESLLDTRPDWQPETHCGAVIYRPNLPIRT